MAAYDTSNIFAKILRGELPCYKVYEDDKALAFLDIMPRAPGHTLVLPKAPAFSLNCCTVMPSAPNTAMAALATFCTARETAARSSGVASSKLRAGAFGSTRVWPGARGMMSRKANALSSS